MIYCPNFTQAQKIRKTQMKYTITFLPYPSSYSSKNFTSVSAHFLYVPSSAHILQIKSLGETLVLLCARLLMTTRLILIGYLLWYPKRNIYKPCIYSPSCKTYLTWNKAISPIPYHDVVLDLYLHHWEAVIYRELQWNELQLLRNSLFVRNCRRFMPEVLIQCTDLEKSWASFSLLNFLYSEEPSHFFPNFSTTSSSFSARKLLKMLVLEKLTTWNGIPESNTHGHKLAKYFCIYAPASN